MKESKACKQKLQVLKLSMHKSTRGTKGNLWTQILNIQALKDDKKSNNTYKSVKYKYPKARIEYQAKSISYKKVIVQKKSPKNKRGTTKKKKKKLLLLQASAAPPSSLSAWTGSTPVDTAVCADA